MITSKLLSAVAGLEHGFGERGNLPPQNVITLRQVHGTQILMVETGEESGETGFDSVMTRRKNTPIGIKTADCQSLLAVDPETQIIAAIHAGWKGTVQRATEVSLQKMIDVGAKAERVLVALGPSMLKSCYEVEGDVASQFQKEFPEWPEIIEQKSEKKWLLDVALTNKKQLLKMGIHPQNIDHLEYCTHCYPDRFDSFRRDGDKSGRMVSWMKIL
ncbi:MAG: peptidoglycan editing factor PgeF [Deltaproteobacteria bacterium]|nr:MAG: peptidoglycan editing factor PgeF [Deltaproteobacteria bacterium]